MAVSAAATVMFATLVMAVVLAAFFVTVVFTAFVMAVMLAAASATSIFATAASASFAAHKVDHTLNLVVSCGTGSNNTAFEVKFLAGKRMVEVYYNFVFFYFKNKTLETVSVFVHQRNYVARKNILLVKVAVRGKYRFVE